MGLILLSVEDNDAFAEAIQIALSEAMLEISLSRVSDGEEALRFLRRQPPFESVNRPDLILLDLNLPRKSGFDVLSEMAADTGLRNIPVVVLSSSNHDRDRSRSLALGAKEYILKPTDFEQLISELAGACSRFMPWL
jgi:CheY-like chemotaxis protein